VNSPVSAPACDLLCDRRQSTCGVIRVYRCAGMHVSRGRCRRRHAQRRRSQEVRAERRHWKPGNAQVDHSYGWTALTILTLAIVSLEVGALLQLISWRLALAGWLFWHSMPCCWQKLQATGLSASLNGESGWDSLIRVPCARRRTKDCSWPPGSSELRGDPQPPSACELWPYRPARLTVGHDAKLESKNA
jgi:hypothetical protein